MTTTLAASDFPVELAMIILAGICVGGLIVVTAIITESRRKSLDIKHREETRREVAAYIAEGSMTPEEGERLLQAGQPDGTRNKGHHRGTNT